MDSLIVDPFYVKLIEDDLEKLGVCIDEYMGCTGHMDWLKDLVQEGPDIKTALLNAMGPGLLNITRTEAHLTIKKFVNLPIEDMPLYINPRASPDDDKVPLPWQVILSRWRLLIGK